MPWALGATSVPNQWTLGATSKPPAYMACFNDKADVLRDSGISRLRVALSDTSCKNFRCALVALPLSFRPSHSRQLYLTLLDRNLTYLVSILSFTWLRNLHHCCGIQSMRSLLASHTVKAWCKASICGFLHTSKSSPYPCHLDFWKKCFCYHWRFEAWHMLYINMLEETGKQLKILFSPLLLLCFRRPSLPPGKYFGFLCSASAFSGLSAGQQTHLQSCHVVHCNNTSTIIWMFPKIVGVSPPNHPFW